jgi:mRNA interferase MazF
MEIAHGEIWWADPPDPEDSSPAGTRPVLVIQSPAFNRSRIQTVITVVITSNLDGIPGQDHHRPASGG